MPDPPRCDRAPVGAGSGADDSEPLRFRLVLDSEDDPFCWSPRGGPATVTVEPGERTPHVRMQMGNGGGKEIALDATIALP